MDSKLLARIGAIVFVAIAITMSLVGLRTKPAARVEPPLAMTARADADPIRTALIRCQRLGQAGATDPDCQRVWAENRRRFLSPGGRPQQRLLEVPPAQRAATDNALDQLRPTPEQKER